MTDGAATEALAAKRGPVLLKRIEFSYKPKHIGLLDPVAPGLAEILRGAGLGEKLVNGGRGIEVPSPDDAAAVARVRALLGTVTGVTDAPASAAG